MTDRVQNAPRSFFGRLFGAGANAQATSAAPQTADPRRPGAPGDAVQLQGGGARLVEGETPEMDLDGVDMPAPPQSNTVRMLRHGAQGPDVERLQEVLTAVGEYDGPIEGVFDDRTDAAVRSYQRRFGLEPDGVVGRGTWGQVLGHEQMLAEVAGGRTPETRTASQPGRQAGTQPEQTRPEWDPSRTPGYRDSYGVRLNGAAPVGGAADSPGARAYNELLSYNHRPNPHSIEETRDLGRLAETYQQSLQTVRVALPVDGGARNLTVTMPAEMDQQSALRAVAAMYEASHPDHRGEIDRVNLYAGPNSQDEYWELKYPGIADDFVSAATAGPGTINIYNVGTHEIRQGTWDHELGHIIMQDNPNTWSGERLVPNGWSEAVAADRADGRNEFISRYAQGTVVNSNIFKEDFAETYRGYMDAMRDNRLDRFRQEYPARAAILDRMFR